MSENKSPPLHRISTFGTSNHSKDVEEDDENYQIDVEGRTLMFERAKKNLEQQ